MEQSIVEQLTTIIEVLVNNQHLIISPVSKFIYIVCLDCVRHESDPRK